MATEVGITVEAEGFINSLRNLSRPALDQPVALALVDTAKTAIVKAAQTIRQRTGLPSATVKDRIFYDRVDVGDYEVVVKSSKRPIPLADFAGTRQIASGVRTRAWGKEQVIKSAFTIERFGGNAFRRVGRARFPIQKLWGPTIGGTFATPEVQGVVKEAMEERLQRALARRIAAAVRRQN